MLSKRHDSKLYVQCAFTHSFIHLFNQTLCVCTAGTVLGHGHPAMNHADKNLCLHGAYILVTGDIMNK